MVPISNVIVAAEFLFSAQMGPARIASRTAVSIFVLAR